MNKEKRKVRAHKKAKLETLRGHVNKIRVGKRRKKHNPKKRGTDAIKFWPGKLKGGKLDK